MESLYALRKQVLGALAHWAVRLSPYTHPTDLEVGIREFDEHWLHIESNPISSDELYSAMLACFDECPTIRSWNRPRRGNHNVVVITRLLAPDPDFDFIDLDALAKGMTGTLAREAAAESNHPIPLDTSEGDR